MCRIFNFYINSLESNDGSTNNNSYYFIDWSATIPRGKYKATFTYNSVNVNYTVGPDEADIAPALIHINLGCNSNFAFSNGRLSNTDIVGILKWHNIIDSTVGKGYLYSDITTNVPFFFNNGLLNNFIHVKITQYDGTTLYLDSNGDQPTDYILTLTFELIDEL